MQETVEVSSQAAAVARVAGEADVGCSNDERFSIELEFVQSLANPHYLNWLAQNGYFSEPAFVKYLKYLQYWRQPEYARFILYPHCLYFLERLQDKDFRTAFARTDVRELAHTQQFYFWQHYRNNRLKEQQEAAGTTPAEGGDTSLPAG